MHCKAIEKCMDQFAHANFNDQLKLLTPCTPISPLPECHGNGALPGGGVDRAHCASRRIDAQLTKHVRFNTWRHLPIHVYTLSIVGPSELCSKLPVVYYASNYNYSVS